MPCSCEKKKSRGKSTILWMDEIRFAPPQRPGKDDSPVNAKEWFPMVSKWCEMDFVHPPQLVLLVLSRECLFLVPQGTP